LIETDINGQSPLKRKRPDAMQMLAPPQGAAIQVQKLESNQSSETANISSSSPDMGHSPLYPVSQQKRNQSFIGQTALINQSMVNQSVSN